MQEVRPIGGSDVEELLRSGSRGAGDLSQAAAQLHHLLRPHGFIIEKAHGIEHAELLGFRLSLGLFLLLRKDVSALLELTCCHNSLFKKE